MDPASHLHQDSILHGVIEDINTETPRQDSQKTCTRNSPCLQQRCLTCSTLTNHVRNLDVSLNNINGPLNSATSLTSPTPAKLPLPPNDNIILLLTVAFQLAIQTNNIDELELLLHLHDETMKSNLDFIRYDRAALRTA